MDWVAFRYIPSLVREETEGMNASLINHCMSSLFCNYLVQIPAVKYLLTQLGQLYIHAEVFPLAFTVSDAGQNPCPCTSVK